MATSRYQAGILAVVLTVLGSFLICLPTTGDRPRTGSAAQGLESNPIVLGSFAATERSGRTIGERDLSDRVWIAAFVFTRCPSSCPRIGAVMKGLQGRLADTDVQLVSISVDPGRDTPDVLARYARALGASDTRWWFLTGPKPALRGLVLDQFKLPVSDATDEQTGQGSEDVIHSTRLALVDRGNRVIGYFDADDPTAVESLTVKARKLGNPLATRLPAINALLNGACAALLLAGWWLVRRGRRDAHRNVMYAALATSAIFLSCYLYYHFVVVRGSVPFQGVGRPVRVAYFTILLSHTLLAVAMVPLVVVTVAAAVRGRFERHTRWSKLTFPIWLYVSITGVVVYLMLYRLDFAD